MHVSIVYPTRADFAHDFVKLFVFLFHSRCFGMTERNMQCISAFLQGIDSFQEQKANGLQHSEFAICSPKA